MLRLSDIRKTRDELSTLELVTRAFGEIASGRMLTTRAGVISNRDYLSLLSSMFDDIRASYGPEIMRLAGRKVANKKAITFLSHNGKTVSVLYSANNGLYGPIIKETFDLFKKEVLKGTTEITIIGELGRAFFKAEFPDKPFTFFALSDRGASREEMTTFARHIVQYDEIHFFFGKFYNVISQKPEMMSLTSSLQAPTEVKKKVRYIFEPDLESVLVFFESELFGSVLKQTTEESTLAKLGSRVFAMDEATSRISRERKKLSSLELMFMHREENKKQLNSLAGILNIV